MENVICKEGFFNHCVEFTGLCYHLVPFYTDIKYWNKSASQEERLEFLDFLNGGSRERTLRYHFYVPDFLLEKEPAEFRRRMHTAEGFLSYVFRDYEPFVASAGFLDFPMRVQVAKESMKVLKIYRGSRKDIGKYLKYEVCFSAKCQLVKPVDDLGYEEIANHYYYGYYYRNHEERSWIKAVKAVLMNPGRIFCSNEDHFISWQPQSSEDAEKIFLGEFRRHRVLDFDELVHYGKEFSPYAEDRMILKDPSMDIVFYMEDSKLVSWDSFGNKVSNGWGMVKVRIPRVEKRPDLFVKNCRKGIQFMKEYVKRCRIADMTQPADFGAGCFHYSSFVSMESWQSRFEAMGTKLPPYLLQKPQITAEEMRARIIEYTTHCADCISAVANFADFLMGVGSNSMSEGLAKHVMECVMLDPLQYIDHINRAISRLARYYVNGEY